MRRTEGLGDLVGEGTKGETGGGYDQITDETGANDAAMFVRI